MSNKLKSGISFGVGMATFFILQAIFKNEFHTRNEIARSIISAIVGGAASGFVFGWLIGTPWFSKYAKKEKSQK